MTLQVLYVQCHLQTLVINTHTANELQPVFCSRKITTETDVTIFIFTTEVQPTIETGFLLLCRAHHHTGELFVRILQRIVPTFTGV